MNRELNRLHRGVIHSLTGFCVQLLLAGLLVWQARGTIVGNASHVVFTAFAGLIVWLHLLLAYLLLRREALTTGHPDDGNAIMAEANATKSGNQRIRVGPTTYHRFIVPILELGTAALLIQSPRLCLVGGAPSAAAAAVNDLLLIAIHSIGTLVLVVFAVYLTPLMRIGSWQRLKCARNITCLMIVMLIGLLAGACSRHFGIPGVTVAVGWALIVVNSLLCVEILVSMILRVFTPRQPNTISRPAFDFYLLDVLSQPLQSGQIFASMLENIFGFDITRTAFGNLARSLLLPAVSLAALLMLGLSTIVIVRAHEQATVMTLGCLRPTALEPGLHFKLPWPFGIAHRYNVTTVQSIHVGSHQSTNGRRSVYREGVPILWTNMHGYSMDELLICSSPRNRINRHNNNAQRHAGGHKVPSVSLAAADVHVQFVIDNVLAYVRSSATPERLLRKLAEACASRFIYRYDIDALFCEARLEDVDALKQAIQSACDGCDLGVRIVHVAITAVHPPVEVAAAFEETIAAMQERETRIQQARQAAVRIQTETTGETERFARLAALADGDAEGQDIDDAQQDQLLKDCGGAVFQVLAEAESYRFSRENVERGKTERFGKQLQALQASPKNYRYDHYFSVIEKGLEKSRKIVLLGNTDKTIMRMGIGEGFNIGELPDDSGF